MPRAPARPRWCSAWSRCCSASAVAVARQPAVGPPGPAAACAGDNLLGRGAWSREAIASRSPRLRFPRQPASDRRRAGTFRVVRHGRAQPTVREWRLGVETLTLRPGDELAVPSRRPAARSRPGRRVPGAQPPGSRLGRRARAARPVDAARRAQRLVTLIGGALALVPSPARGDRTAVARSALGAARRHRRRRRAGACTRRAMRSRAGSGGSPAGARSPGLPALGAQDSRSTTRVAGAAGARVSSCSPSRRRPRIGRRGRAGARFPGQRPWSWPPCSRSVAVRSRGGCCSSRLVLAAAAVAPMRLASTRGRRPGRQRRGRHRRSSRSALAAGARSRRTGVARGPGPLPARCWSRCRWGGWLPGSPGSARAAPATARGDKRHRTAVEELPRSSESGETRGVSRKSWTL